MKHLFLLIFLSFSLFAFSQDDCTKQKNIAAEWIEEETVIFHPAVKVLISPAIMDTITQKICVKEAAYEEYISCCADGTFKKCTKEIEAVFQYVTFLVEKAPAQYLEISATSEIIKILKLKRNGYIKNVPCNLQN